MKPSVRDAYQKVLQTCHQLLLDEQNQALSDQDRYSSISKLESVIQDFNEAWWVHGRESQPSVSNVPVYQIVCVGKNEYVLVNHAHSKTDYTRRTYDMVQNEIDTLIKLHGGYQIPSKEDRIIDED